MNPMIRLIVAAALAATLVPASVHAQTSSVSSIVGIARDASGGVLPVVTVEAVSPALADQARSTVTDGEGRYQLIELPPGAYVVTYSLEGFATFRQQGLEIAPSFTATINAELKVGSVQESITVTAAASLI